VGATRPIGPWEYFKKKFWMQDFLLQLQKDLPENGANVICDTVEDI
jgi:hypothetical protein